MIERAPELLFDEGAVTAPDIYLVPPIEENHDTRVDVGTAPVADVLINVVIDVDGVQRQLCINVTKRTLGNDQSIDSFFDRFENIRQDKEGRLIGDFGKAELLATNALHIAERQAGL